MQIYLWIYVLLLKMKIYKYDYSIKEHAYGFYEINYM